MVTLTFRAKAAHGGAVAVLTSGFIWGGNPKDHTAAKAPIPGSGAWEEVTVRLQVRESPVGAAIGFDYNCPERELLIDDLRIHVQMAPDE